MENMFTVAFCDNTTACVAKVNDAENVTSMIVDEILIIENIYSRDGYVKCIFIFELYKVKRIQFC